MGRLVAFDTNVFIYWLDETSLFFSQSAAALKLLASEDTTAAISMLTITELQASMPGEKPSQVFNSFGDKLRMVAIDRAIASEAGKLRQAHRSLRTPDALHLASAIQSNATLFISNDGNLVNIAQNYLAAKLLTTLV